MQVNLISEYSAFLFLQKEWNDLLDKSSQKSVFLTHQWFDAWWAGFGRDFVLNVYEIKQNDRPIGYAPLMRSGKKLFFLASEEVTDYCDFIYSDNDSEDFFSSLLGTIREEGWLADLT